MELETLKGEIKSELEKLEQKDKERGLSSYVPQLTFYKIHGLTYRENFHSKFIAFLLNPKGQHGCDSKFLDYFIQILKEKNKENHELQSLNINDYNYAESETGSKINKELISGGRVDIRIFFKKDKKNIKTKDEKNIIIENKINAIDQWAQLVRIKNTYPCPTILYLTLFGKPASSYSLKTELKKKNYVKIPYCELKENDYIRISYKDHIKDWLVRCLEYIQGNECKPDKLSILLNDYLSVVQELTYVESINEKILPKFQDVNSVEFVFKHYDEINKIINEKVKYDIRFHLKKYLVKEKFINKILNDLIKNIGDGLEWKINEGRSIMQKGWGFQFYKEKWEKYNIKIGFIFNRKNLEDCYFGLLKYNPKADTIPECFAPQFKDKNAKSVWYCREKFGDYSNWYIKNKTFNDFMADNIIETPFYKSLEDIVQKMCNRIESIISSKTT